MQSALVGLLSKDIEEREGKTGDAAEQELEAGVRALAKCLGPVAEMFEEGARIKRPCSCMTS